MALKIAMVDDDGKGRHVHPETMTLLLQFGDHRNICDECERSCKYPLNKSLKPCTTGEEILRQLLDRPDVTQVPEP